MSTQSSIAIQAFSSSLRTKETLTLRILYATILPDAQKLQQRGNPPLAQTFKNEASYDRNTLRHPACK